MSDRAAVRKAFDVQGWGKAMLTHSNWGPNGRFVHCAFEPCNKAFDGNRFLAADGRYLLQRRMRS
jgi:hypothetical protein